VHKHAKNTFAVKKAWLVTEPIRVVGKGRYVDTLGHGHEHGRKLRLVGRPERL